MYYSNNEMDLRNCIKCDSSAAMMCQRCFEPYCSVECQITDWRDHKLNCLEMPKLVPMKALGAIAAKSIRNVHAKTQHREFMNRTSRLSKNFTTDVQENNKIILPDTWRTIMPPPTSGYFQALVQFVEVSNDGTISTVWFSDTQHQTTLQNLFEQLQREVRFNEPMKIDQLAIGSLVVANCPDRPYRAEIISLQAQTKQATLRLIDRGNVISASFDSIYSANLNIASLQAFAFGAIFCPPYQEPIERYSMFKIRVCSTTPTANGLYKVEINAPKPQTQIKTMSRHPSVKLLKVLNGEGHVVLLQQFNCSQHYEKQHQLLQNASLTPSAKVMEAGEIVAACLDKVWYRALLLGYALVDNVHLVYLFDEGRVCFCHQLSELGAALATDLPPRVLILQLEKILPNNANGDAVVLMVSHNQADDACILHVGDFEANGKLLTPLSLFNEAKYGYWREKPTCNSIVRITDIITHAELCVTAGDISLVSKILACLAVNCDLITPEHRLKANDFVLAQYTPSKFMRGTVINTNKDKCKILDVDTGIIRTAPRNKLRHSTLLLCALPSQLVNIKLDLLRNIPDVPAESSSLKYLRKCIDEKIEFKMVYGNDNTSAVNLISYNKSNSSLNKQLLPLLFQTEEPALPDDLSKMKLGDPCGMSTTTAKTISRSLATPKPLCTLATPPNKDNLATPFRKEINIAPLPEGDSVELFIIDSSSFDRKILTVAAFDGGKVVNEFNRILELTLNFIKNATPKQKDYAPRINELCLAIFKDDGEWYRARCLKALNDNNFMVEFFDYGNCSEVAKKDIIGPLSEELCYPQFTHNCELIGVYDVAALKKALAEKPLILCKVVKQDNKYMITPNN